MPELRELTPSARLQLEIMCQLHTNDIQPVSFLSKLGGVAGGSNNDDDASSEERRVVPERPRSGRVRAGGRTGGRSRPRTAGGGGQRERSHAQPEECWVSGVRSPKYVHQRPQTRGGGERLASPPLAAGGVVLERGDGGLTFEPDADYYAQLVRLQSLITKKQKKKKEKVRNDRSIAYLLS